MAPHWKCGSGQPVAGSNPALSAIARIVDAPARRCRLRLLAHAPSGALARILASALPWNAHDPRGSCAVGCAPHARTLRCARVDARVRLGSDRPAGPGPRPCYPSRAVLGGELAVPCSLQSAPAGPNPLSRSPFSDAARRCDVEDRVPRSGEPRTVSGPEGSSTKRSSSGAAERPGPSRPSWWARAMVDRRRVHGTLAPLPFDRRRS